MSARFKIQGRQELQFWLRAFQLEFVIEQAMAKIAAEPDTKGALCPIVTEYECGRFFWQVFMMPEVDQLGLMGGRGVLWLSTDQADRERQIEECAQLAKDILPSQVTEKIVFEEKPRER